MMMITMLAVLTAMPSMAQYGRRHYSRSITPRHTNYHSYTPRSLTSDLTYFGIRIGPTVSTINADDIALDGDSPKSGFSLGVTCGVRVAPATPLYLETGLSYIEKGGKGGPNGTTSYSMNYLEAPFLMKYKHTLAQDFSIQPFAGVYCAAGVSGKIREQNQRKVQSSFADNAFKRFDGGLRIGCGLQYDYLYTELGYDIGLSNIERDDFNTANTGCFFVSVGLNL